MGLDGILPGAHKLALKRGTDNYLAILQDAATKENLLLLTGPRSIKFKAQAGKTCREFNQLKASYARFDETGFLGAGNAPCAADEPNPEVEPSIRDENEVFVAGVIERELLPAVKELERRAAESTRSKTALAAVHERIRRANIGCLDGRLTRLSNALARLGPEFGWSAYDRRRGARD